MTHQIDAVRTALDTLRAQAPLVQCITNYVAMNVAANAMLAAGASPAMVHCAEESGAFAQITGALTVNIGTLSPAWVAGMRAAIEGAQTAGLPWVLDPVAHFATAYRGAVAVELLGLKPTILRGNASEIFAFSGQETAGRGADSGDSVTSAVDVARVIATQTGGVVAVTGERDFVTDGTRSVWLTGGSATMPKVTALGCSLTAVMGAFAAVSDPFTAAIAALMLFNEAGERAEAVSGGPGSFAVAFLDALSAVQAVDLKAERLEIA